MTELATGSQAPAESAPQAATGSAPDAPHSSEGRASAVPEANESPESSQTDDFEAVIERLKSATPEQKKRVLGAYDPDEAFGLDDRLSGKAGKLAQQQAQQLRDAERRQEQALAKITKKVEAVRNKDPDAALQILEEETGQELTAAQQHASAREGRWHAAVGLYQSGLLPADLVAEIKGKTYGDDPDESAKAFYGDIIAGIEKRTEARLRKELEPVLRKQIAAELAGEEPTPDVGAGAAPARGDNWKSLADVRAAIRRASPQEYARREAEFDAAVARFQRGRAA